MAFERFESAEHGGDLAAALLHAALQATPTGRPAASVRSKCWAVAVAAVCAMPRATTAFEAETPGRQSFARRRGIGPAVSGTCITSPVPDHAPASSLLQGRESAREVSVLLRDRGAARHAAAGQRGRGDRHNAGQGAFRAVPEHSRQVAASVCGASLDRECARLLDAVPVAAASSPAEPASSPAVT